MKLLLTHIMDELLKHNIKKNVIHSLSIDTHIVHVCVCMCVCVCVCVCMYITCINWYLAIDSENPMLTSGDFSLPLPPL